MPKPKIDQFLVFGYKPEYSPKPALGVFKLGKLLLNSEEYCEVASGKVVGRLNAGLSFESEISGLSLSLEHLVEDGWKVACEITKKIVIAPVHM